MGLCKPIIRLFGLVRKVRAYVCVGVSLELGWEEIGLKVWLDWRE